MRVRGAVEAQQRQVDLMNKLQVRDFISVLRIRDPGSDAFLTPGSGMGKKSKSGSGMNIPDHISESLASIFGLKILKFFDADPDPESF
jgi:hypothetical protein